jgi:hypothetical protein
MNGQVSIEVQRRDNVLAIPNDAVRSPNEVASVAPLLGLDPDSVSATLKNQRGGGGQGGVGRSTNGVSSAAGADSMRRGELASTAATQGGGQRGGFNLPDVTDKQCQAVTAAMAKHPDVQGKISDLRTRMMSGELDRQAMQAEMKKIYTAIGLDADVARACNFKQRSAGQGGGTGAGGGATGGGAGGGRSGSASAAAGTGAGTGMSGATGGGGQRGGIGAGSGGGRSGGRRGLVFVSKNKRYEPRMVRLGVSNYDYSEVLSGVQEGEQVAILNVAVLQAKNQADMNQVRSRSGLPGVQRPTTGGATGGAGGAGGRTGGGGAPRGGGG